MSKVPPIRSSSALYESGLDELGKGRKGAPPKSPHDKDTLSSHIGGSSQGIIGYALSGACYFFTSVLIGFSVVVSIIRWPFVKLGILSAAKTEEPNPSVSVEEQKKRMQATFNASSHSERLRFLAFKVAQWSDPSAQSFFIKLFNEQDQRLLDALANSLSPGFRECPPEKIKAEMPKLLFEAFSTKPEERTFSHRQLFQFFHQFLLEFPDYALAYVETCFGESEPSSRRFEGLGILACHGGSVEEFHVEKIGEIGVDQAIANALVEYYGKLSQVDKEKLLAYFQADDFEEADTVLRQHIIEKREDLEIVKIFSGATGYNGTETGFPTFLEILMDPFNDEEWQPIKQQVLTQFDAIREAYAKKRDHVFLGADWQTQVAFCEYAQESEPNIYRLRLETIATNTNEKEVGVASERLLHHYEQGSIELFMAYRDKEIARLMETGLQQHKAEQQFVDQWFHLFNFSSMRIMNREGFNRAMLQEQMSPQFKAAAQYILDKPIAVPRKEEHKV